MTATGAVEEILEAQIVLRNSRGRRVTRVRATCGSRAPPEARPGCTRYSRVRSSGSWGHAFGVLVSRHVG